MSLSQFFPGKRKGKREKLRNRTILTFTGRVDETTK